MLDALCTQERCTAAGCEHFTVCSGIYTSIQLVNKAVCFIDWFASVVVTYSYTIQAVTVAYARANVSCCRCCRMHITMTTVRQTHDALDMHIIQHLLRRTNFTDFPSRSYRIYFFSYQRWKRVFRRIYPFRRRIPTNDIETIWRILCHIGRLA